MSKMVLVVAAHADDEALGCGGTIARHVADGDVVHVVYVADGVSSRPGTVASDGDRRQAACGQARTILGIASASFLGLPDNRLDSLPLLEVVQALEAVVGTIAPQLVYTHHHGDLNIDHRIVHDAVLTACRPLPGSSVREILVFEVMSSSEWSTPLREPFAPSVFVDISAHLVTKMQALAAYGLEMRSPPHSRSLAHVELLARHRGYSVGVDAAEAFMVVRVLR